MRILTAMSRCFVRPLLLGLVVTTGAVAAPACGKGTPGAPAVVAGAPAGTVLEVAGKVEAVRGGTRRALTAGDPVSGDDVVETGADGRVTLRLLHNGATLSLPPGRSQAIGASPAWALAPVRGGAGSAEISAAAGRHTGEQEVDTGVSATGAAAPAAEAKLAAATGATPEPAPRDEARREDRKVAMADGGDAPSTKGSQRAAAADTGGGGATDDSTGSRGDAGPTATGSPSPAPPPPPPPPPPAPEAAATMAAAAPTVTIDLEAAGDLDAAAVRRDLAARRTALAGCSLTGATTVTLAVDAAGKITKITPTGATAAAADCVRRALGDVRLPVGKATTTVRIVVRP